MEYFAIIISVLSALFTGGTLYDQWRANREGSRSERYLEASKIACWAAIAGEDEWGVQVTNASSCPVWNVVIETKGWNNKRADYPIHLDVLPPGDFFIQHKINLTHKGDVNRNWEVAKKCPANLNPKTRGNEEYNKIVSIRFEDRTKTKWIWSPMDGLQRVNPKQSSGIAEKCGIAKPMQ